MLIIKRKRKLSPQPGTSKRYVPRTPEISRNSKGNVNGSIHIISQRTYVSAATDSQGVATKRLTRVGSGPDGGSYGQAEGTMQPFYRGSLHLLLLLVIQLPGSTHDINTMG